MSYLNAILALCYVATPQSAELSDDILQRAFEHGNSLVVANVLWVSSRQESDLRTKIYYYTVIVRELVVAGDLSSADVREPIAIFTNASYGDALDIGSAYLLVISKCSPKKFDWSYCDYVLRVTPENSQTLREVKSRARDLYAKSAIRAFREKQVEPPGALPEMPEDVLKAFEAFRNTASDRCDFAKTIYESDFGTRIDESTPWRSDLKFLPPKMTLSRSQIVRLLGEPTFKHGFSYVWFCGRYDPVHAGILSVGFNAQEQTTGLLYHGVRLADWIENPE